MSEIPCNIDIERAVLGLVFLDPQLMDGLRPTLEDADFVLDRHRLTWATCRKLYDAGSPPDALVVANDLMERGQLDAAGGISYLCGMRDNGPLASSIDSYIGTLKEKAALRKILNFASVLTKHCQLGTAGADAMREQIAGFSVALTESAAKENRPISTRDLIDTIGVQELLKPRRAEGLAIPWRRLNGALAGLNPATMTVLAAYTGRGKTSMALQIATYAAKSGKAALYWTMEMAPAALFRRLVNQLSGVNGRAGPTFSERQLEADACARLYDEPVFFDRHSRTVAGFRSSIAQVQAKTGLGLVVVDYLQLIRASGRAESRTREVGENSRSLKLTAMDFNLPFLVLSQFSRPDEKKAATIHSLKESGDIENDADAILLLNAPEFGGEQQSACTVNIGKNREGPAGIDVPLMWRPTSQTFHSVED